MGMQILTRAVRTGLVLSWEVDDQKRDEEDDTGVNTQRRRGRFMNDKVDKEV